MFARYYKLFIPYDIHYIEELNFPFPKGRAGTKGALPQTVEHRDVVDVSRIIRGGGR